MAFNLVSYDASGSDTEEEDMDQTSVVVLKHTINIEGILNEETGNIPKPSDTELKLAEIALKEKNNLKKIDLLGRKGHNKKGKVMIGIPSLADLEKDDEKKKTHKKSAVIQAGQSKLFSRLPPPKNSPFELPKKDSTKPVECSSARKNIPLIPQSVARKQATRTESDDEDISDSFFTIDEPVMNVPAELIDNRLCDSSTLENENQVTHCNLPTNYHYNMAHMLESEMSYQPTEDPQLELDSVALQALQGASGVKRKLPDDAQVIEIKGERLTYDPNMSYLKSMSEEKSVSRGPDITYNKVQKKKHQITYLAAQAKAREVDLKNQWAQNKSTRRQTQAKYGF